MANAYPDALRPYYGAYVRSEVEALRRAGVGVDVLAVRGYAGKRHYMRGAGSGLALNRRGGSYDVVHAYYGLMGIIGRLQLRAPLVISFTGGDIQGDRDSSGRMSRSSAVQARVNRAAARLADATTTQNAAMEELLPAQCRARNHVIPTGVDLDRFNRLSRDEARSALGWDPDQPTVIFMADPARRVKNFPLARASVERLRKKIPGLRLRVAGKVAPADVPTWMAAADALVFTSVSEGSPNVIKEAMAAALPTVSTPVGDVPEHFRNVSGCYLCARDPAALAEGLERAIAHGRAPQAREAIARLDVRQNVRRIIGVYESVVGPRLQEVAYPIR